MNEDDFFNRIKYQPSDYSYIEVTRWMLNQHFRIGQEVGYEFEISDIYYLAIHNYCREHRIPPSLLEVTDFRIGKDEAKVMQLFGLEFLNPVNGSYERIDFT